MLLRTRVTGLCFAVLVILGFSVPGCGGRNGSLTTTQTEAAGLQSPLPGGTGEPNLSAQAQDLDQATAEVESTPVPPGVDAGLWRELTAELTRVLASREASLIVEHSPVGDGNAVTTLNRLDDGAGAYSLAWTYVNIGDYNRDSQVGVSDLTPVGQYFNAQIGDPNWGAAEAADGNHDGAVTVADITPIGQNFFSTVRAYNVYASTDPNDYPSTSTDPNGSGARLVGSIDFDAALGTGVEHRTFSFALEDAQGGESYWVRPTAGQQDGPASNLVSGFQAPAVTDASPLEGTEDAEVGFHATYTGTAPVSLAWDFGGGAEPNVSDQTAPTVTLGAVGEYDAAVTATSAFGEDTFHFTLTVVANAAPEAQLDASPQSGTAPLSLDFDAGASNDPDGSITGFEFDFDEGAGWEDNGNVAQAQHTYNAGGVYNPAVRVTDNRGATNTATVQVTVDNALPVAELSADPTQGYAPLTVSFDASGSSDPNGTLVDYEWDLDGDTIFNEAGDESDARGATTAQSTYDAEGVYSATVRVTDDEDATATAGVDVEAGPNVGWQHTWGGATSDTGGAVGVDLSGNVYAVGSNTDPIFLKYNADGELQWAKTTDPVKTAPDFGAAVDASGDIYYASEATGIPAGIVLLKVNSAGEFQWQKTWGVAGDIVNGQIDVGVDSGENMYVSALSYGIGGGGYDLILFKIAPDGNLEWQLYINHGEVSKDGFGVDADGNSYITGAEGRLIKTDKDGTVLWQKSWETGTHDHPYALVVDVSGNIYWAGASDGLGSPYRPFLIKLDSDGNMQWQISYDAGAGSTIPDLQAIVMDSLGNIFALVPQDEDSGPHGPQVYRFNTDGVVTGNWEYNHAGGDSSAIGLAVDDDGYLYLAGNSIDNTGVWEAGSGTADVFAGVLSDAPVLTVVGTGVMSDTAGSLTPVSGTEDSGGGGSDVLVIKVLADALPSA